MIDVEGRPVRTKEPWILSRWAALTVGVVFTSFETLLAVMSVCAAFIAPGGLKYMFGGIGLVAIIFGMLILIITIGAFNRKICDQ